LGDQRPGASQLPANPTIHDRRDALHDRLAGEGRPEQLPARDRDQVRQDRLQNRDDRQQNREQLRGDRLQNRDNRQQNREQLRDDRQQNRDDRLQNREQNRDDWQQHRDEIRDDWQKHRDEARDDWQDWFDDHYGRYGGWYAGYAPGYWGRWDYLWDNYPVAAAAGLTWWGANSLGYQFGYSDYYNPYYAESMSAYYTAPILTVPIEPVQETVAVATPPPGVSSEAVTIFDQARAAFLKGQYDAAMKLTDTAVAQMPHDAVLHEFRALVLFALQRYAEAAAAMHAVLDVGPGWDWKTLSGLYPSVEVYTSQLRALEAALDKEPKAAALRFLLGYHYLSLGHQEKALSMLRQAAELQPKDAVAAALVATLSPRDAQPARVSAAAAPKAFPAGDVAGTWTSGSNTAKYSMSLRKDGTFTWAFSRGSQKQEVKGVYTVEDNVLALEPDTGGVLLAELAAKGPDTLHFKMIGGASDDKGLKFQRGQS
jgi:tetratricopeptide (TPR) repeat protein